MSISSFRAASAVGPDPESAAEAGGAAPGSVPPPNRLLGGGVRQQATAVSSATQAARPGLRCLRPGPGIPPGKTGDAVGVLCHDDLVSYLPTPPPLIGRDAELRALTEAAGLGATARSGLVLLSGDA